MAIGLTATPRWWLRSVPESVEEGGGASCASGRKMPSVTPRFLPASLALPTRMLCGIATAVAAASAAAKVSRGENRIRFNFPHRVMLSCWSREPR